MNDYLVTMACSIILATIKQSIKNPASKESLRGVLQKIHDQIEALYLEDYFPARAARMADDAIGEPLELIP